MAEPAPQTFVYRAMDTLNQEKSRRALKRYTAGRPRPADYDPEESL